MNNWLWRGRPYRLALLVPNQDNDNGAGIITKQLLVLPSLPKVASLITRCECESLLNVTILFEYYHVSIYRRFKTANARLCIPLRL